MRIMAFGATAELARGDVDLIKREGAANRTSLVAWLRERPNREQLGGNPPAFPLSWCQCTPARHGRASSRPSTPFRWSTRHNGTRRGWPGRCPATTREDGCLGSTLGQIGVASCKVLLPAA